MKPGRRLGTHSVQHGFYRERGVRASRSVADYCGDRLRALSSAPDCNDKRGYEVRVHLEKGLARPWAEPLVTRLRVVPFIVTLGTMGIARGLAKYLADEQKIDAPARWLATIMAKAPTPSWLLMAPGAWLMLGLALAMGVLLTRTVFGVHTYAIGSNEATAHLSGVRVSRLKVAIYALSGLFAGLAGVMQYARLTVGDPTTAVGKELDVIAAVVIGGASLSGGVGGIGGSLVGAFLMSVLANGCTLTGVPNYVQEILIGFIIVIAVALDRLRHRRSQ